MIKIDYSPRQSGKTTRLISWLYEDSHRRVITFDHQRAMDLDRQHPDLKGRFIDVHSYMKLSVQRDEAIKEVAIDDADYILKKLFGNKVTCLTISSNEHD